MIADRLTNCTTFPAPEVNAPWMRRVLLAAAVYNLLWGAAVVLAPLATLRWLGIEPAPLYPEFWQCLGMVIGVYGIGYAIASVNPRRHWPIVLVGLIGKVLGPIGFAVAAMRGRLPLSMGWTILLNDLIWWVPFAMILWRAAVMAQQSQLLRSSDNSVRLLEPMGRFVSQFGSTIRELSRRNDLLLVFLRHSGCTFCREALYDITRQRSAIEARGVRIALVHMGTHEPTELLERYQLTDLHCFRDPDCVLYETFGLRTGNPLQLFGPKILFRGIGAWIAGHGIGRINGNGFRLGGLFLLRDGKLVQARKLRSAADRPDYATFIEAKSDGVPTQVSHLN